MHIVAEAVGKAKPKIAEVARCMGEVGGPPVQAQFDDAIFRGVIRAVGQQLRPDLDATALDHRAARIAEDLFVQLRHRWADPGVPPPST